MLLITGVAGCGGGSGSASSGGSLAVLDAGCSRAFQPNYTADSDPHTGRANVLRRWRSLPVTVYFANGGLLTEVRKSAILAGFGWWTPATENAVSYTQTNDPNAANITVAFEQSGETEYGALTTFSYDGSGMLTRAAIVFNVTYLTDAALLTPAAAHEFGHALGIDGHSADTSDLMAYSSSVYALTAPSSRDANTMKTNYNCVSARSIPGNTAYAAQPLRTQFIQD